MENNLEQEKLPSYEDVQKNNQIQQCISALNNPPPDYTTVVNGNNSKESNYLVIDINSNENNSNLNNGADANVLSFFDKNYNCIYRSFSICWLISFATVATVVALLTKSLVLVFVVAIAFFFIHYAIIKLYQKT
jgi:hypothetical protein